MCDRGCASACGTVARRITVPTFAQKLALYRNLLRESNKMMMPVRKQWLVERVRSEFRVAINEKEEENVIELFQLGEVQLDTIKVQVKHLLDMVEEERKIETQKTPDLPKVNLFEEEPEYKPTVKIDVSKVKSEYFSNTVKE